MSFEGGKKNRVRFTYEDDVILLREIVSKNPLLNSEMWEEVKTNVCQMTKKTFSIKTLRQHMNILLEQWTEKENKNQKRLLLLLLMNYI